MASENVEIVRRAFQAALGGPKPDWATLSELYATDHELITRTDAVDGGSWTGGTGFRDWLKSTREGIEFESAIGEVFEIDEHRVLLEVPTTIRGRQSEIDLGEHRLGCVLTLRDGKIVRTETWPTAAEALAAVRDPGGA